MSAAPPITVIIPAFNVAPWLPMLFDGLDRQTFRDFETIFVDDGSTDKTGAILNAYAASRNGIQVLHQQNAGVSVARNRGIDAASGIFIVFVDADDAISSSYLADLFSPATSFNLDVSICKGFRFRDIPGDMNNHPLAILPKPATVMSGPDWFETTFTEGEVFGYAYMMMVRRNFLNQHAIRFKERVCMAVDFRNRDPAMGSLILKSYDHEDGLKSIFDEWVYGLPDRNAYIQHYVQLFGQEALHRIRARAYYSAPANYVIAFESGWDPNGRACELGVDMAGLERLIEEKGEIVDAD